MSLETCDACYSRKVKCDKREPCYHCLNHHLDCQRRRAPRKRGPKSLRRKTIETIECVGSTKLCPERLIETHTLSFIFKAYQEHFCVLWPVEDVWDLLQVLEDSSSRLSDFDYCLSCTIAAGILSQLRFVPDSEKYTRGASVTDAQLADEAIKFKTHIEVTSLHIPLTTKSISFYFFLYVYFINGTEFRTKGILSLQMAMSISQLMGLHEPETYLTKSSRESNKLRKWYYLLFICYRYLAIRLKLPLFPDPIIPLPLPKDERSGVDLSGFITLLRVYSIPTRELIECLRIKPGLLMDKQEHLLGLVMDIKENIMNIKVPACMRDADKANVLLSKCWLILLIWSSYFRKCGTSPDAAMLASFPIQTMLDLTISIFDLPLDALVYNGPAACAKLLLIIGILMSVSPKLETFSMPCFRAISSLLDLLGKLNIENSIFHTQYQNVCEKFVNNGYLKSGILVNRMAERDLLFDYLQDDQTFDFSF